MANISEEKWIEMLEKKSDGSFIAKYPKVKSNSGITFDEHLADDAIHVDPLVQEIIVETSVASITFNNLDGNADGGYFLVSEIVSTAANNSRVNIFVENDIGPSNYQGTLGFNVGATPSDGAVFISTATGHNLSYCDINISPNGVFNTLSITTRMGGQLNTSNREKKATITNITRLDLIAPVAGTINAGSRFRLYRRKNG